PACTGLQVKPKQLSVGHATTVHVTITDGKTGVPGVRIGVKGAGVSLISPKSNALGKVTVRVKPKHAGIVTFRTIQATSACRLAKRVGVPKGAEKTLTG